MSHPYAFPLHHHRNHSSTPSSSMSHLSLASTYSLHQQHQAHPSPYGGAQTSGSTTSSAGPSNRSDMAEASATSTSSTSNPPPTTTTASTYVAPERRRRRSSRGVGASKAPSRKPSSTKSLAETKANPDEPLIPTRHYQFKSFESFDPAASSTPSIQSYTSSSTTSLPAGGGYTFGPPPTSFAAETGQGGEAVDGHAGALSSSAGTSQQPPKKSKAIFSVGKKVVKEVLGGGGNNTALPAEAKAVYYGRGGAGGAGARNSNKPQPSTSALANGVHPNPAHHSPPSGQAPAASQRCESRQTGSYYTGSSSGHASSILSSPYAESLASSPNATSVEDGQSVYAPSSYSAPLTMSSLGRPSPSHRSVSPSVSALSEDNWRRDSVVSTTTTSYSESSYGSDVADSWQEQQQTVWQNPFAGETIQEVERFATPVSMEDPLSPPGGASEGSVTYDGAPAAQQAEQPARQVGVPATMYQQQQVLRHRPSQPSLLSTYPRHSRTQSGRITPSYSSNASATSSASSTPYQPSNATSVSAGGGDTNLGGLYPISSSAAQAGVEPNGDLGKNGGANAARLQQVYQAYVNGGTPAVPQPQPPQQQQQQQQQVEQVPRTSAVPQDSLRPQTSPSAGRVSRPLPDPLATAVGQLSLMQNPLSVGWPIPQQSQQQQPKQPSLSLLDPALVSALYGATNAASQLPLNLSTQGIQPPQQQQLQQPQQSQLAFQSGTGLITPNYTIQPQPQLSLAHQQQQQQALGGVGAQDYTQSLVYQQALAEQQALARRLAQLERLQQEAARLAAQDPYTNLNSGRGLL